MASDSKNTAHLKTQAVSYVKTFTVFDGVNRPITIYTAATDTPDGGTCSRVDYAYIDPTSPRVEKMKEDNATWQAIWDMP